jgi:hypothetical protein
MAHACNTSTQETMARGLGVPRYGISEFREFQIWDFWIKDAQPVYS